MLANQRMIAPDGYEVMLFPLEYMNISQGEYGNTSHYLAMDFLGWGANGRILQCGYYAPCSCHSVASFGGDTIVWQSNDLVHCADGSLQIVTFLFAHDNNLPSVGERRIQGQLIGHTGTAGQVTGDHCHFNTANGTYAGMIHVPDVQYNAYELKNSEHIYNICYVNDTVLYNDYGYNWLEYHGGVIPPSPSEHHFPWVLYAQKLRQKQLS